MDKLDNHRDMNNVETKEKFRPVIQAAMKLARKKMDSCLGLWLCCDLVAPEDLTKIMKSLKKRKREDESVG
ncbi:hypothetical protein BDR03DRAFT_968604 [Suillus americanus]|nr:hypothetical protein BDR03DRAFT_968604 [Suillus americanus]